MFFLRSKIKMGLSKMLINLWVKDNLSGSIHQVGTDVHDSLEYIDGQVCYVNMQNLGTTLGADYAFIAPPDLDDYVKVTVENLYLNRDLIHRDLMQELESLK